MVYIPVIGLEVHAELQTRSKMFCACPVVDSTQALPNTAVCPVCAGMPGVLPVVNQMAVEYALRVALALQCEVMHTSLFARKNYFYPDLPKGYQISQFEYPLAVNGIIQAIMEEHSKDIRIRRVHLEEDTGKLTHVQADDESYSLVDLNRAGVPLLEIVSEPDMNSLEEVRAYATGLRAVLVYLGVNSGDMSKGVMRFEANVSLRPVESAGLGTRVEIKNLNSFRAMERAIAYEIGRQTALLRSGESVRQETLGWDDATGETFSQRSKEEAHDYRYFPEPDLPPLIVGEEWVKRVDAALPELPQAKIQRFQRHYGLERKLASLLAEEPAVAAYFESVIAVANEIKPQDAGYWISGPLFGWMNLKGESIERIKLKPEDLAALILLVNCEEINQNTARTVLTEMLKTSQTATEIVKAKGLQQINDPQKLSALVQQVLHDHPEEFTRYLAGKETLVNWFFGEAMRRAGGKAHPARLKEALEACLTGQRE